MNTLKKILKPIQTGYTPAIGYSLRVPGGMEICKQQSLPVGTIAPASLPTPRLVVAESKRTATPIITKTRAEINGLRAILGITSTTQN